MKLAIPILIGILAFVGFADSVYLTMAHFGIINPATLEESAVCSLTDNSCEKAATSTSATTAGIPNALLGTVYFAAVLGVVGLRLILGRWFALYPTFAFLLAGLGFSAYLTQELIFKLQQHCPFCLTAHAINVFVLTLFVISVKPWRR
ncbi:MAG: vitamin K epoxide reductase family protein [Armatimonadota bacterium]